MDRLASRPRPDLAAIALEHRLAEADPLRLTPIAVQDLLAEYGVKGEVAHSIRVSLWRKAFTALLQTGVWDEGGSAYVQALRGPLDIGEDDEIVAERDLLQPFFAKEVASALTPDNILQYDAKRMAARANQLGISRNAAVQILTSRAAAAFASEVTVHTCRMSDSGSLIPRRMTRSEIHRIRAVGQVTASLTDDWRIRLANEERWGDLLDEFVLTPISVPIQLNHGEVCLFSCDAELLELQRGKFASAVVGKLYATNTRLIFNTSLRAVVIKYESLLEIEPLIDGLTCKRSSGKPLMFGVKPHTAFLANGILHVMFAGYKEGYIEGIIKREPELTKHAEQPGSHSTIATASQAMPVMPRQETTATADLESAQRKLASLVGLEPVKREVESLVNLVRVRALRRKQGLPLAPISFHLVFTGKPGTGKTTVARVLAEVFSSLNMLSKGHLVETDRSGLVGGYVGQTALKTADVVRSALGGVLFIDEAYALAGDRGESDFGREAIETLLKLMEDHRDDLVVIAAGYDDRMQTFLASNPGVRSRFTRVIDFPDYSVDELVEIIERMAAASGYTLSPEAVTKISSVFSVARAAAGTSFGNARLARNLFERALGRQADRLSASAAPSREDLCGIDAGDIPQMSDID
jgi:Holliday junction resolvasome RuvABC ATP-dependent DNA helicase subunit